MSVLLPGGGGAQLKKQQQLLLQQQAQQQQHHHQHPLTSLLLLLHSPHPSSLQQQQQQRQQQQQQQRQQQQQQLPRRGPCPLGGPHPGGPSGGPPLNRYQQQLVELNTAHSMLIGDQQKLAALLAAYVDEKGQQLDSRH
ncbi:hypothetical protein EBH_0000270 [Eimeria brunetti]|uniref:Uncharacterized protein n=1 Tax=Eimeria brunetti TaxID=51314 RepID=U6LPM8_9EIME|nr:hypothetical protein EBH_0000270 [Eimeria brunetti]